MGAMATTSGPAARGGDRPRRPHRRAPPAGHQRPRHRPRRRIPALILARLAARTACAGPHPHPALRPPWCYRHDPLVRDRRSTATLICDRAARAARSCFHTQASLSRSVIGSAGPPGGGSKQNAESALPSDGGSATGGRTDCPVLCPLSGAFFCSSLRVNSGQVGWFGELGVLRASAGLTAGKLGLPPKPNLRDPEGRIPTLSCRDVLVGKSFCTENWRAFLAMISCVAQSLRWSAGQAM